MKRMVLLLTVAALMIVTMAVPAAAKTNRVEKSSNYGTCVAAFTDALGPEGAQLITQEYRPQESFGHHPGYSPCEGYPPGTSPYR